MNLGEVYIQRSIEIVQTLDPAELAKRDLSRLIGRNEKEIGYRTSTFSLGEFATAHGEQSVALKDVRYAARRVECELRDTYFILERAPELVDRFPEFVGLLAITGEDRRSAIITEDASQNGKLEVKQAWLSPELAEIFKSRFEHLRDIELETLERSVPFWVGNGAQRLLDLSPSIFGFSYGKHLEDEPIFRAAAQAAKLAVDQLTISIKSESTLALALSNHKKSIENSRS